MATDPVQVAQIKLAAKQPRQRLRKQKNQDKYVYMELITIFRGPLATITTLVIGYLMIRAVIWITQRSDE